MHTAPAGVGTTRNRETTEAGRVPLGNGPQSTPTFSGVRNGEGWKIRSSQTIQKIDKLGSILPQGLALVLIHERHCFA